jgi:thymidylate synthase (FAD)
MKLINSSVTIKEQESGINGIYKQIEWAGRHCYKSLDKITENSAKEFVDRMIKLGHGAILEHGTIYLNVPEQTYTETLEDEFGKFNNPNNGLVDRYRKNKYSKVNSVAADEELRKKYPKVRPFKLTHHYITTNLRVIVENGWEEDLEWQCEPTEHHEKRITAKFTCDRGVSHEFVRHRVFSFAQESQRYCNYNKDKFNNELTFIKPTWLNIPTGDYTYWDGDWCDIDNMKIQLPSDNGVADNFLWCLNNAGMQYRLLINKGLKPQEARAVLPNATKTELVMTGFESDWEHFFELRCSGAAHPDARKLADELKSLMNVKNIELNSVK